MRKLASKVYKDSFIATGSIVVGGYNVTKLAFLADRLKRYRTTKALSQAKLSRKIAETTTGGLKFSQSFLCRYLSLVLSASTSSASILFPGISSLGLPFAPFLFTHIIITGKAFSGSLAGTAFIPCLMSLALTTYLHVLVASSTGR